MGKAMIAPLSVIPAKAGISPSFLRVIPAFAGMTILFLCSQTFAAPYEYAPETCDFSISFPDKPFIEKKCDPAKPRSPCEEVVTYTQSLQDTALNFRVTCDPQDAEKLKTYKPEDLKVTLSSMVKDAGLTPYATDSAILEGTIKTAIAMATGNRAGRDVIYIAQMWLGRKSALTLEGQMTGPDNKRLNDVYSGILKSIKTKSPATGNPPNKKP